MHKKRNQQPINYRKFIEDFNILTITPPQGYGLYEKPHYQNINEEYQKKILKNTKGERYKLTSSIDQFKIYGSGIYLLFKFLKLLILIFAIISIILFANIAMFSSGEKLQRLNYNVDTFAGRMAVTTYGNCQQRFYIASQIIYFICLILLSVGIGIWKQRQQLMVLQCSKQNLLPSYYTVILQQIPIGYSQNQLKQCLQNNYGEIKQIFSAKQFHNDLIHYKEIHQIIQDYIIQRNILNKNRGKRNCLKLIQLFKEFYYHYKRMKSYKRYRYQPAFAFITFKSVTSRQKLLNIYSSHKICCYHQEIDPTLIFKGQPLKFAPSKIEPDAIIWENITLTTKNIALRIFFQVTLILIVLAISILVIFLLALAGSNLINPAYGGYTPTDIKNMNDPSATKYYCLNLSLSQFYDHSMCHSYSSQFTKIIILQLVIPLIISLLKFIFTQLMNFLVQIRRHETKIKKIQSQIIITFIFYFILSGLLQFIINIKIITQNKQISIRYFFQNILSSIYNIFPVDKEIQLPNDFTSNWFFINSNKIILLSMISFNLTSLFNLLYSIARKKACIYFAQKQDLLINANKYLKAEIFEIQFIYALILNIIFFSLLFGPVIPLVWPFSFLSLFILFWVHKLIFIRFCQQPLVFSHSINHVVTRITLFGIVFSCFTTPLLYGGIQGDSFGQRYIHHLYFPILGGIILVYMFFKKVIYKIIMNIKNLCIGEQTRDRLPSLISKTTFTSENLPSYSMHQNPIYSSILKILYTLNSSERNRSTFMLNENLNQFFKKLKSKNYPKNSFQQLLHQIQIDRVKFNKIYNNSKYGNNPFQQKQKTIKEILKIYNQSKNIYHHNQSHKNSIEDKILQKQLEAYQNNDKIIQPINQQKQPNQEYLQSSRNLNQNQNK